MIEISYKQTNTYILVEGKGHSEITELCNSVSILFKQLELSLTAILNIDNCIIEFPKPGNFKIEYNIAENNKDKVFFAFSSFIITIKWLIQKYNSEIKLIPA